VLACSYTGISRLIASIRSQASLAASATGANKPPAVRPDVKRLSFSLLTVAETVESLVQRGLVTDAKRPNPKQRQKMKAKGGR
jgi:hypothetical protein